MVSSHEQQQYERARLALIARSGAPVGAARRGEETQPDPEEPHGVTRPRSGRRALALGREHIPIVLAGAALVLFAAWVLLSRSAVTELPVAEPSIAPPSPVAPSSPAVLRVHVLGAVVAPGVVTVPEGAIVQDALLAAGGLTAEADPGELNFAAPLSDGQQVIVGTLEEPRGEVLGTDPGAAANGLISINSASVTELQELPGVGPVLAEAIVDWRDEHGPFTDIAQLDEVAGVGPKLMAKLAELVSL